MIDRTAVRLTRQKVNTGIWICAALTMAASAISGVTAFYYLQQDGWGIASGAMTAFAVDVALWVVLTGDKLMEAIGLSAGPWARAVRWGTAIMSVTLNVTAAAVADISQAAKLPLVVLHVFVPLVMVGLAELRGEYARQIAPLEQEAVREEEARKRASIVTPSERTSVIVGGSTAHTSAFSVERPVAPGVAPTVVPAPVQRALHPVVPLRQPAKPRRPTASSTPVKDRIIAHLDKHHRANPLGITAEELARKIKANPHTCKKVLADWRRGLVKEQAS